MSLNKICFFNNVGTVQISEVISVENSEYLQLEITGTANKFKIIAYAQVVAEGEFLPLVVLGNGDFKFYDTIETNGFYRISTRGVLNIKLNLIEIESGNLNCFGSLSLRRDISDWNETDETGLGFIKNKPTILTEDNVKEIIVENGGGNSPYVGVNGNWYEWNNETKAYIDTGVQAEGYTPNLILEYNEETGDLYYVIDGFVPNREDDLISRSEFDERTGDINTLTTTDKTNLVRAINEINEDKASVSYVDEQISEIKYGYSVFTGDDFVQGYMNDTSLVVSSKRIRLKNTIKVKQGDVFSFEGTLYWCVYLLADDNISAPTVISSSTNGVYTSGAKKTYEISEDGYVMINMQNGSQWNTSTNITPADFIGEIKYYTTDRITELSDQVEDLIESTQHLNGEADGYTNVHFESGTFSEKDGIFSDPKRIRLKNTIKVKRGDLFLFENPDDLYFSAFLLAEDSLGAQTALKVESWAKLTSFEVTEDGYFYMIVANAKTYAKSTAITLDDFNGTIYHYKYDPRIEELMGNRTNPYLIDKDKAKAFTALFNNKTDVEPFLFFTDPHLAESTEWENEFSSYMNCLKRYYESVPVNNIICGGDWLGNSDLMTDACYKLGYIDSYMRSNFKNYHLVVGNHDMNEQGKLDANSENYSGVLTTTTMKNLWYRGTQKAYYRFEGAHTDYYVLDTLCYTTENGYSGTTPYELEQLGWFANSLKEKDSAHTAIFMHKFFNVAQTDGTWSYLPWALVIGNIIQAFNSRTTLTVNGIEYDFLNCTGHVDYVMCGHSHKDYIETIGGVPCIITTQLRESNIPTFDLCLADYDNNKLYLVRVGSGDNRTIDI